MSNRLIHKIIELQKLVETKDLDKIIPVPED
jgi:hypothetical protein